MKLYVTFAPQSVEKHLKAYLAYRDIIPEKTHNLTFLNKIGIEKDNEFQNIATLEELAAIGTKQSNIARLESGEYL
jgi:HEPN domain-containing protein